LKGLLTPEQIEKRVLELGPWYHNLDLRGVKTARDHFLGDYPQMKWERFAHSLPADLTGKTVLDVGCNAGFYSMKRKKRGARKVVGIDSDKAYLAQARFAAGVCGMDIEFRHLSVYNVRRLKERFDVVLFMGVIYHLRYPLLALDLLHTHAVGDLLVFQSMQRGSPQTEELKEDYPFQEEEIFNRPWFPRLHFVEKKFSGDETNWWIPNRACSEAMLRSSGFEILEHPEEEVFICRRVPLEQSFDVVRAGRYD
jgi:tRNA (mo5U34)-methyltransferase